jgi:hypothetical protein
MKGELLAVTTIIVTTILALVFMRRTSVNPESKKSYNINQNDNLWDVPNENDYQPIHYPETSDYIYYPEYDSYVLPYNLLDFSLPYHRWMYFYYPEFYYGYYDTYWPFRSSSYWYNNRHYHNTPNSYGSTYKNVNRRRPRQLASRLPVQTTNLTGIPKITPSSWRNPAYSSNPTGNGSLGMGFKGGKNSQPFNAGISRSRSSSPSRGFSGGRSVSPSRGFSGGRSVSPSRGFSGGGRSSSPSRGFSGGGGSRSGRR